MEQLPLLSPEAATDAVTPFTVALDIGGMRCAGCVGRVEKCLLQQSGVLTATVNLVIAQGLVQGIPGIMAPQALAEALTQAGFPSQVHCQSVQGQSVQEPGLQTRPTLDPATSMESENRSLGIALILLLFSGIGHGATWGNVSLPILSTLWFHCALATLALLGPGWPILREGWQGLRHHAPNMSTLISLGSLGAYGASWVAFVSPGLGWECFFDEPVMIIGFILLGRTLEARARAKTGASLRALLSLQPAIARWLPTPASEQSFPISVQQVQVGDWLQVLPGDQFPVDGCLQRGETLVDESMLTGESLPILKQPGDLLMAGTLNQSGVIILAATRTGADTALAQIISLVETAQTRKAPIQRLADTVAGYFTYGVLGIAGVTFLFWYGFGYDWLGLPSSAILPALHHGIVPDPGASAASLLLSLKLAISVLVVACPCALGLATPTAILVGTSLGAERGLLIRGGDVLERVQHLDTVVFDKTGTLTTGQLSLQDFWLPDGGKFSAPELLQIAASVEQGVRHPLALAICDQAQSQGLSFLPTTNCQTMPGRGAQSRVQDQWTALGTAPWLVEQGILVPASALAWGEAWGKRGSSLVYVAIADACVGGMAFADTLRPEAQSTLTELQSLGLKVKVLTGDQLATAEAVLAPLGLSPDSILANVSPGQKAAAIAQLQSEGAQVGMVGDGINDAPALAQANVGIALASGTDAAMAAADIVLMRGATGGGNIRLTDVAAAVRLSRQTFRKIQQNLVWASAYNLIGIPLAAGFLLPSLGVMLSPGIAGGMMALSSVCVVTNSLLLRAKPMVGKV
jgi:P-type Cu2+ transporter